MGGGFEESPFVLERRPHQLLGLAEDLDQHLGVRHSPMLRPLGPGSKLPGSPASVEEGS
jgi:hypothetical protein